MHAHTIFKKGKKKTSQLVPVRESTPRKLSIGRAALKRHMLGSWKIPLRRHYWSVVFVFSHVLLYFGENERDIQIHGIKLHKNQPPSSFLKEVLHFPLLSRLIITITITIQRTPYSMSPNTIPLYGSFPACILRERLADIQRALECWMSASLYISIGLKQAWCLHTNKLLSEVLEEH